jgi:hypothetical protein
VGEPLKRSVMPASLVIQNAHLLADVIWPALFVESRLLSIWVIALGLVVEYFFVWRITNLGPIKSIMADVVMNAASTIPGIILIPAIGLVVALVPGEFVGTFSPITWAATFLACAFLNTAIEWLVLWKLFKQDLGKKQFWLLALANGLSVGIAFASFLIYPIKE